MKTSQELTLEKTSPALKPVPRLEWADAVDRAHASRTTASAIQEEHALSSESAMTSDLGDVHALELAAQRAVEKAEQLRSERYAGISLVKSKLIQRAKINSLRAQLEGLNEECQAAPAGIKESIELWITARTNPCLATSSAVDYAGSRLPWLVLIAPHIPARIKKLQDDADAITAEIYKLAREHKIDIRNSLELLIATSHPHGGSYQPEIWQLHCDGHLALN